MVVRPALKFHWLLTIGFLLWSVGAHAQESVPKPAASTSSDDSSTSTKAAATAQPDSSPPSRILELRGSTESAAPDVFLLPDEFGKLRKVIGFRYEDFMRAWRRNAGTEVTMPPRYVIDDWDVSGKVYESFARLRVEFAITVSAEGWVNVPIQLPKVIVQQLDIDDQAAGEGLIFDKERHGYVVWLSGTAGQQRRITLEGLVRLKLNTGKPGIELHLPRATTSRFSLWVPDSFTGLETSTELTLATVAHDDKTTEVQLIGQANPLRLSWTPAEENASSQAPIVQVEGQTTVQLDGRRASYEATLTIASAERSLEQIQVRLPEGAKLKQGEALRDYQITEIGDAFGQDPARVVEIRLPELRHTPWKISLSAERPLASFSDSAECVVEGFEVLDAFPQSGTLTLEVDERLQAYFDTHDDIDQIPLPDTTRLSEGNAVLGRFRYSRFPWHLVVFTSPRQRRVSVKPEYNLSINPEVAQLEVAYDYQLTGAQIFSLRVDLQGWKLTDAPIESGGLVNLAGVVVTKEGLLVLPLEDSAPQQLRLNLSLRKDDVEMGNNTFLLPEPKEAFVVDGKLRVSSSSALRVTPTLDEMAGLIVIENSVENFPPAGDHKASKDDDQIHLRTFLARPKFVAQVSQRQRQLTATAQTKVDLDQQTIRVRQRIDYLSKYRPVSQLAMSLPEQMWQNDSLTISLNGEPLAFGLGSLTSEAPLGASVDESANEQTPLRPIIVSLPRPIQNEIPIEIAYEMPVPAMAADDLSSLLLPLAMPTDEMTSHAAQVRVSRAVLVSVNQRSTPDEWKVAPEQVASDLDSASLSLQTEKNLSFLSLYVQLDSADRAQLAILERAWIQSWIAARQRQERAVFRFRTENPTVFARTPLALDNSEIEVLLDGIPWPYELLADNRVSIAMPENGGHNSHTLELRYQRPAALPSWGAVQNSLPRLECRVASAPIYWQLILPNGWQAGTSPEQLIPDYWLGWKNYRWGRQPTLTQADLEQITGSVSAAPPTHLSTQYVYRALEMPDEIRITVIRRSWLFLGCALIAFSIGLIWLYTSFARSGMFWLAIAFILMFGVFTYPEITLLVVEVILLAGLMTFATAVLRRVFAQGPRTSTFAASLSADSSAEITEPWQHQSGLSPTGSETTATIRTSGPSS